MIFSIIPFLRQRKRRQDRQALPENEHWENPFLSYGRQIIDGILEQKQITYQCFRPIVIDTDQINQHFGEEDDVDQILSQLQEGLNYLEIWTDRPEYFQNWTEFMSEEYGLQVQLRAKQGQRFSNGNVILDFERNTPMVKTFCENDILYIPFQKSRWILKEDKPAKNGEQSGLKCLDIKVPIGYNMLIVKVKKD